MFAYYATPGTLAGDTSRDSNLPAVVLVHGGGGTAFREWAELWAKRGYAAIAMDLAGHRPVEGKNPHSPENRTRLADGGPESGRRRKIRQHRRAAQRAMAVSRGGRRVAGAFADAQLSRKSIAIGRP